jgi:hypothetical protein
VRAPGRVACSSLAGLLATATGAWWSGTVPCAVVVAQPACQLAVSGGPVLDTRS